jgi:hypothetical protein
MRKTASLVASLPLFLAAAAPSATLATPGSAAPMASVRAETTTGEVHVTLINAEYVKVELNGQPWENIEFEKGGKQLLVKGLDTTLERNALVLLPSEDGLGPVELDVLGTSFKKKRVGRDTLLVSTQTARFEKPKPATPAEPSKPEKAPAPAPEKTPSTDPDL